MRHYGLVLVVVGLLFFGFQAQAQITIDGISDDWQPNWQLDTNPPIPAPDNPIELTEDIDSVDMDVDDIYVIDDSNYLYVRIDMNELGDLYTIGDTNYYEPPVNVAIYIDADADSATGITWGWWRGGFDYMAYLTHNDRDSLPWGWMEDAGGLMYIYDQAAHPNWGFNLLPDTAITAISALSPYNWLESALPRDTMPDWGAGDSIGIAIVVQQAVTWLSDYAPDDFGSQIFKYKIQNLATAPVTIDGISDDWQPNWQLDTNPPIPAPDNPIELTGDIDSVDMDVDDIYVIDDSNYLYVRTDMNELGDLYTIGDTNYYEPPVNVAIYIDADADSATGITWGWWRGGFDYMAYLTHNDRDSLPWGWMEDAGGLMYIYDQAAHPNWGFNLLPDTAITAISALSPYNWLESALPRDSLTFEAGDTIGIAIVVQQAVTWLSDYVPDDFGSQLYFHTVINDFSGVEEHEIPERPKIIGLSQNHPNPFSKFTTLEFYLPEAIFVQLEIYDIQGRKVRSLKRGKFAAGSYTVTWDRKDYRGKRVPPGIYFCRLATNKKVVTRKMAVIP